MGWKGKKRHQEKYRRKRERNMLEYKVKEQITKRRNDKKKKEKKIIVGGREEGRKMGREKRNRKREK